MKGVIPTSLPTTGQDVISPFSVLSALVIRILQIVKNYLVTVGFCENSRKTFYM